MLWPLSLLFASAVALRRFLYRRRLLPRQRSSGCVPVVVVGNISVGGSGKTPLVIGLVQCLGQHGYNAGIVSRGYGGQAHAWPLLVTPDSDPHAVGDEPVLLAKRCRCPVVVAPDRVAAVRKLLADHDCNVVICDDGLQHYALARDIEIAVIDGRRRFGNGFMLPAGPLREPENRLRQVDFVVSNGPSQGNEYWMRLRADCAISLDQTQGKRRLSDFDAVHGVAAIGDPARFFIMLESFGLTVEPHAFVDHHRFKRSDLQFGDAKPILMTEKDAVKCATLDVDNGWYVPVQTQLEPLFRQRLIARLNTVSARGIDSCGQKTP